MEYINRNPKVFILSGKARSGKNVVAGMIEEYYNNKKCIQLSYAYYLKQYAKKISNWNGLEETKPRELLQSLGIDLIKNIDEEFLIKRVCEDIRVYSHFYDILIITDARLIDEIIVPKKLFDGITIRVNKIDYENGLTNKQKEHITETGLDNYDNFDYEIENNGDIKELQNNIIKILEEVNYE